jgi:aspartyl-tRNA synthetase
MYLYRTHKCGEVSISDLNKEIKIGGFLHNKRDHGGLLFLDVRDHYGLVQVVISEVAEIERISKIKLESVFIIEGKVQKRKEGTTNASLKTGEIEIIATSVVLESEALQVPFAVNSAEDINEELRLKYRFLDLRRENMHKNIMLRSAVISEMRKQMEGAGFMEFQTPILTASSPEGARDFLVPSRVHPGKFYALPQAPQQFKQLLMVSGFDRYFQIAPCFRDEDARADRSPGEFYQLDIEMAFVTQEEVFATMEPIIHNLFKKFAGKRVVDSNFVRIPFDVSMLKYGSDKPDLRNPIINFDAFEVFNGSDFKAFSGEGKTIRGIPAPKTAGNSRKFFDDFIEFAKENGAAGLAYIIFDSETGEAKGPIAKFLTPERLTKLKELGGLQSGDSVFFSCDSENKANKIAGFVRSKLGKDLKLIDENLFKFCWIVDFPFYELNEDTNQIEFSHNPFSMPQIFKDIEDSITILENGNLSFMPSENLLSVAENNLLLESWIKSLNSFENTGNVKAKRDLIIKSMGFELLAKFSLKIKAFQYDIVCNGVELSSGAIRNHKLDVMYKAFEIAGYSKDVVDEKFAGMVKAFSYGAPPHGGFAPGVDRIVMLLAGTDSIRDIICFPLNGKAEDLLMNAPSVVNQKQLDELHIDIPESIRKKHNIARK